MKEHESGRSMVEMLGVLAIIGVLSVAVLYGYHLAVARYKANETIHEVMLRATNVPMVDEEYIKRENNFEWLFSDLGEDDGRKGRFYTMETRADNSTGYLYKVEVFSVYRSVCERILNLNPVHVDAIYVKESGVEDAYAVGNKFNKENAETLCDNEENTMAFYFDDNWDKTH